ncbi:hypothetical protein LJK87_04485 [Paenibacillus sp. P25]|nr:hypothetical protein LJK87_04485 [Paenibacillus sp. P25]
MKRWGNVLQISFTYIGTVVGAGFATGQEILQFFTRYGWMATLTIGIACALFVWLGIKLMLIAHELNAKSYEDLNNLLFGPKIGGYVSLFTLITLFGVTTVMLAGARLGVQGATAFARTERNAVHAAAHLHASDERDGCDHRRELYRGPPDDFLQRRDGMANLGSAGGVELDRA